MSDAYLVLADGTVFKGRSFGYEADAVGELVFTTGMCGYIETLTDPSYYGQIVMQTFPLIGNYGIIDSDFDGKSALSAYVVREYCEEPSNFRCSRTLDSWLKEQKIPGLCGIDTREVTRLIRSRGVMNAMICRAVPDDLSGICQYAVTGAVSAVSSKEPQLYKAEGEAAFMVVLIDYGVKRNIIRELTKRGCDVVTVPYDTPAEEILAMSPDGVMLSNGPGDPAENTVSINELAKLLGKKPIFGICLGHQLLALAAGGSTTKLKFGHRGVNQPAKEANGQRTYITSQNHGYAVVSESLEGRGVISMLNANDGTNEGVDYPEFNAFSVQFHPEASSGPHDTEFLFDRFLDMMRRDK